MKKYQRFLSKYFQFLEVKFSMYLYRHVFVMPANTSVLPTLAQFSLDACQVAHITFGQEVCLLLLLLLLLLLFITNSLYRIVQNHLTFYHLLLLLTSVFGISLRKHGYSNI